MRRVRITSSSIILDGTRRGLVKIEGSMYRNLAVAMVVAVSCLSAAKADDLKVRHPIIELGEFEVDHNSTTTFDRPKSGKSNNQTHATEFEYGAFEWWKLGFEVVTAAPTGENLHVDAFAFENYF